MKKLICFVLFCSVCLSLPVCMKRLTHGFRIEKLKWEAAFHPEWEISPLSEVEQNQIKALLNQPFRYLDRGAQCYVFESQDGLYVIKLFRFDSFLNPIRVFFRTKIRKRDLNFRTFEKISHLFSACQLAYHFAKEETELLYLHLNPTKNELPSISLRAPLGKKISLSLDSCRFALQKKAEPFEKSLILATTSKEMGQRIDSLFSLLQNRAAKGIGNSDGNLFRNFGFIGSRAIEIDFGNYGYSSDLLVPMHQKKEIDRFARSLRSWLQVHAPQWVDYLDQKMEGLCCGL